jgi:hypothetical protein
MRRMKERRAHLAEMCLDHRAEAKSFFERSLAIDPNQAPIREALSLLQ